MSRPGFEPGPPAWEASTLQKSHPDSLIIVNRNCYIWASDSVFVIRDKLLPVSLRPVINLYIWIYSRLFIKFWNGSYRAFRAMGETDLWKNRSWKSRLWLPLSVNFSLVYFLHSLPPIRYNLMRDKIHLDVPTGRGCFLYRCFNANDYFRASKVLLKEFFGFCKLYHRIKQKAYP